MAEKMTSVNTISERTYLVQEMESQRVSDEQMLHAAYRLTGNPPMHPQVSDEGSWLQRQARNK